MIPKHNRIPDSCLQVLAYLNSNFSSKRKASPDDYFDMPHTQKQWELRICDRKTKEPHKIFSETQDSFSLHYLHSSLETFASIAVNISEPKHHDNKRKCDACNLKSVCEFRMEFERCGFRIWIRLSLCVITTQISYPQYVHGTFILDILITHID